uniref:Uncharacterized protein n=1 Tax=Arundo donax TaxID=35708 RepID=A0A0A9BTR0_ARUDO
MYKNWRISSYLISDSFTWLHTMVDMQRTSKGLSSLLPCQLSHNFFHFVVFLFIVHMAIYYLRSFMFDTGVCWLVSFVTQIAYK